jgi:hypothetical protein
LQKTLSYIANNKKPIKLTVNYKNQQKKVNTNLECTNEEIHGKMPVYSCSCGAKILIIPDLLEMCKAIKNHLVEHKELSRQILTEECLTQEILLAIIEAINGNLKYPTLSKDD